MADAGAPPAESSPEIALPPDFSLKPFGPDYETVVVPLVPQLRQRLEGVLPAGSVLWGAELLNCEDAAGTHVLAKCVPGSRDSLQALGRLSHRSCSLAALAASTPDSCVPET